MPTPDYQSLMLPLLRLTSDQHEHTLRGSCDALANELTLSEEDRRERIPSGTQTVLYNRVGWAKTYMTKAGLLETTGRGKFKITQQGLELLATKPEAINVKNLRAYPEFVTFHASPGTQELPSVQAIEQTMSPEEQWERSHQILKQALASDLIAKIKSCSPPFFEQLVVDLLVTMGYGGSRKDAGEAIGRSGDGGIDGIIKEDKLGLDAIYLQAKRWEGTVGRPDIQKFAGSLEGNRARKGVFITTSSFSQDARAYVQQIEKKIVLIDGAQLTELMIDCGLGVHDERVYSIKRIDHDYFEELD